MAQLKNRIIQVPVNENVYNRVVKYMEENDWDCIAEAARDLFKKGTDQPAYITIQKERLAAKLNPQDKATSFVLKEEARLEAKQKIKENKHISICNILGGKVTDDGYCIYPRYHEEMHESILKYDSREPLEDLNNTTIDYVYTSPFADDKSPATQKARILSIANSDKNKHLCLN